MMILENSVTENSLGEPAPTRERATLAEINQTLKMASIGLQFEFAKESGEMIAKVADVESGDVIRQIPSEEVVRILKSLSKLQGLLINQTILNKWYESRGKLKDLLVSQTI